MKKNTILAISCIALLGLQNCKKEQIEDKPKEEVVMPSYQQDEWKEGDTRYFSDLRPAYNVTHCVEVVDNCHPVDIDLVASAPEFVDFDNLSDNGSPVDVRDYFSGGEWKDLFPMLNTEEFEWLIDYLISGACKIEKSYFEGVYYYQIIVEGIEEPIYVLPVIEE